MKMSSKKELPNNPRLYAKRPDMRIGELPDRASSEELASWQWWIMDNELYEEVQGEPILERIYALTMPLYQYVNGTPDPAKILAFFCLCHERRVYPPSWIMNELYNRFNEYLKDNIKGEKKRLGEYFGEPARGNRSPVFRKMAFKSVIQSSLAAVDRLRYKFDCSKEQALGIVALRLESVENNTSYRFDKGEAALEKAYREWCKMESRQDHVKFLKKITFSEEETLEFLRSFPPGSFTGLPQIEKLLKK